MDITRTLATAAAHASIREARTTAVVPHRRPRTHTTGLQVDLFSSWLASASFRQDGWLDQGLLSSFPLDDRSALPCPQHLGRTIVHSKPGAGKNLPLVSEAHLSFLPSTLRHKHRHRHRQPVSPLACFVNMFIMPLRYPHPLLCYWKHFYPCVPPIKPNSLWRRKGCSH